MSTQELTVSELAASFELAAGEGMNESEANNSAADEGSGANPPDTETAQVEKDDPPNPVLPTANEIFWSAVFFLLFWLLMKYVLLPPIRRIQKKRTEHIEASKDTVEGSEEEKAKLTREHEMAISSVRQEAAQILEEARSRADEYRSQVVTEIETDINQKREKNEAELDTARQQAFTSLKGEVESLASQAAGLVLGEAPDDKLVKSQVAEKQSDKKDTE